MRSYLTILMWSVLLGAAASGCGGDRVDPSEQAYLEQWAAPGSAEEDSLVALLRTLDLSLLREAFGRLDRYAYTRYVRTEQFDEEDYLVAFEERLVRHAPTGHRLLSSDSAGTFDFGFFRNFVSASVEEQVPVDLARYAIPEEPPYLSGRTREAFLYRLLPDTLLLDAAAQSVEVRARPIEGDGQNIRRVRYYVDRATQQVVAMSLSRVDLALLFREESQFYIHVRPGLGGGWVPYNTRFQTLIQMPFREAQRFRTVSTFYDYERAETPGRP